MKDRKQAVLSFKSNGYLLTLVSFLLLMVFTAMSVSGCSTIEWKQSALPEIKPEKERGLEKHNRIVSRFGEYYNPLLADYVKKIGLRVASVSERPELEWTFTILDTPETNAYATEAGYVYITRGLLAFLRSEDELAAVLAHEVAHICNRDLLHQEIRNESAAMGVLLGAPGLLFLPPALTNIILSPITISFAAIDRGKEHKADIHGVEYLKKAGYQAKAMHDVLTVLKTIQTYEYDRAKASDSKTLNSWHRLFLSHPDSDKRQEKLLDDKNEELRKVVKINDNSSDFIRHLNGIVIGAPKTSGIPFGELTFFPEKSIALLVPEGWSAFDYEKKLWVWRKVPSSNPKYNHTEGIVIEASRLDSLLEICTALAKSLEPKILIEPKSIPERTSPTCYGIVDEPISTLFGNKKHYYYWTGFISELRYTHGLGYIFKTYPSSVKSLPLDSEFQEVIQSIIFIDDFAKYQKPLTFELKPLTLKLHTVKTGETYATLAKKSRIKKDAEKILRALNHQYPSGEIQVDQIIKTIE